MKLYLAEVIELFLDLCCALVNHAGGCWLVNRSPLSRLSRWAVNVRRNDYAAKYPHEDDPCRHCGVTLTNAAAVGEYRVCVGCGTTTKLA